MAITITKSPDLFGAVWGNLWVEGTSNALNTSGRSRLRMRILIQNYFVGVEGSLIATIYEPTWGPNSARAFRSNVAPLLRHVLRPVIEGMSGDVPSPWEGSATYANRSYKLTITELFDDADGNQQTGSSIIVGNTFETRMRAHRAADISGRRWPADGLLTLQIHGPARRYKPGTGIPVDAIYTGSASIIQDETGTNMSYSTLAGRVSGMRVYNADVVNRTLTDGTTTTAPVKYIADKKCYPGGRVVYFVNRHGGYEMYYFTETDRISSDGESIAVDVMQEDGGRIRKKYPSQSFERLILTGRDEVRGSAEYLRDIANSPEVFEYDGTPLYVVGDNFEFYNAENFRPQITVLRPLSPCIGY